MFSSFAFASPALLGALVVLPAIWWLLKLTPPRPQAEVFPPLKILATVLKREETPARSPWWLTLLRMLMATLVIFALAEPVLNPRVGTIAGGGPLVLVMDNGWASGTDWDRRVETASGLIDEAESKSVAISTVFTAEPSQDAVPTDPATAREHLRAAKPRPLVPDRERAVMALQAALNGTHPGTLAFITDGVAAKDDEKIGTELSALQPAEMRVIADDGKSALAVTSATNGVERLNAKVTRLASAHPQQVIVDAQDQQGRAIATGTATFAAGQSVATAEITAPYELRNDFARLSISGLSTAGSVHLLDDGFRRRKVALLSGDSNDEFQPLLSPLYYIERALQPYADLIKAQDKDLPTAVTQLLQQNPSVVVMADIGRMPPEVQQALQRWLQKGGTLIRFAGPRLAAAPADDPLVPVMLRQGERQLGGALSWAEPQALAPFPANGPFAGLAPPTGVLVKRQVLAEPTPDLAERTWASLADGTPLVTTRELGAGRIVLFHVSAEASWSNLPISGEFVEMLRRIVQLSHAGVGVSGTTGAAAASLPPYRLLTERGALTSDAGNAKPLELGANRPKAANFDNPPGLYGSEDGFTALNLLPNGAELKPVDLSGVSVPVVREALVGATAKPLKPILLGIALVLFILDSLVVLFMGGAFARLPKRKTAALLAMVSLGSALSFAPMDRVFADDSKPGDALLLQHLDNTHLAYVKTGEPDVDELSERGLSGLSEYMTYRTTLEPGAPVGLDIAKDELSIYPIIFWPISATAPMPSAEAISRIDAYMRSGGTVLFDTRDQINNLGIDGAPSPNAERLRAILANIDIPPLEPVPKDHVLTRSFYLLHDFPGRYTGSPLWVEARQEAKSKGKELTSGGDGVTPIMITGNDFLGAWAIDANGVPLLPTVPADERQREISYRVGVNIMMYMLTGNYKADQVHVPALLERLGQ
ncbi:putative membrane protein (TIGR02226 family) [Agrobacterium vitis]|nr:putative membrane protein (TIGR02226 family) [Agrobacterium vitis]